MVNGLTSNTTLKSSDLSVKESLSHEEAVG